MDGDFYSFVASYDVHRDVCFQMCVILSHADLV